jgi:phosphoesterase RecJ-like protein
VVLSTHLNADGDGAGSETALAHYLRRRGLKATIVNPTPFPQMFEFLLEGLDAYTPQDEPGRRALSEAEFFVVLDTSEPSRLGSVYRRLGKRTVAVLDHHPPTGTSIGEPAVRDPGACATGELVFDLIALDGQGVTRQEAEGLYVAIATDTGSFRYSNTAPRTHEIAAQLLRAGVDPEAMYRRLYARFTPGRVELIRRALSSLKVHEKLPIAWIRITSADLAETGTSTEDLEDVVEYARRIREMEVALLLRELDDGRTKVSLRSTGGADVARVARTLGGGGHEKAAGAIVAAGLDEAEAIVLEAVAEAL